MKIGLIGYGNWGKNHARVLTELGVLSGIYDQDKKIQKKIESDGYKIFNSLKETSNESDGVVLATPAHTHFDLAKKIISSTHLLIEKPIVLEIKDCKNLIKLSEKYKKKVMVGHQLHFHPAIMKMQEIIKNKEIGNIKWIYSNRLNMGRLRVNENVLWSFAPHDISLMNSFAKSDIKNISIQGTDILKKNNEDATLSLYQYKNGINAHIFASWFHPFKEQRFIVVGTEGTLSFSDSDDKDKLKIYKTTITNFPNIDSHKDYVVKYEDSEPLKNQASYFIEIIKAKYSKTYINSIYDAFQVMDVLDKSSKLLNKQRSNKNNR